MDGKQLTAWGRWVRDQPRGTMVKAQLKTGLAYSTIHAAQTQRVRIDVAEILSAYTKGEVKVRDIRIPRRALSTRRSS